MTQRNKASRNETHLVSTGNTKKYIPFLKGRPQRSEPICSDDVHNLLIALNTGLSFDEFLAIV